MEKKNIVTLIAILMSIAIACLIIFVPLLRYRSSFTDLRGYQHSADILIRADDDFTDKYDFPGQGSLLDPYRIENLTLDGNDCGIAIFYTTKHFVIKNCNITANTNCIYLSYIADNTAKILNNFLLIFGKSDHYIVAGCITILGAPEIEITNNIFTSRNSRSSHGIDILSSDNTILLNNSFSFLRGIGIEVSGSFGIYIFNNSFFEKGGGIKLYACHKANILSNIFNNSGMGCLIYDTKNASISENQFSYNEGFGIKFIRGSYTQVNNNSFISNSQYGINIMDSTQLKIFHNNFINNVYEHSTIPSQASDNSQNSWYNSLINEGNYWSDLIWDDAISYLIDGPTNNTDPYPLRFPVDI